VARRARPISAAGRDHSIASFTATAMALRKSDLKKIPSLPIPDQTKEAWNFDDPDSNQDATRKNRDQQKNPKPNR